MSGRRVVVTGLGLVTPLGVGVKKSWTALLAGTSATVSLGDRPQFSAIPSKVAALVPDFNPKEWLAPGDDRKMAKFTQYAISAAEQALQDAGYRPETDEQREMTGVCCGSGIGSFEDAVDTAVIYHEGVSKSLKKIFKIQQIRFLTHKQGYRKVSPMFVPRLLINMAAGHLSMKYGLRGPNHSVSTACTTGLHAIGDASRFIQSGDADVMLAGGSESCIHPLAMAGFARAKSLSTAYNDDPAHASRPFDRGRDGFVIGEGAGMVVLEVLFIYIYIFLLMYILLMFQELEHAKKRGANIYAEIKGYGLSGDAHHMTAPPDDGRGAALCMRRALAKAQISAVQVGYVNAHATSTPLGDVAENRAIKAVLSNLDPSKINISSCKGAIGHLLGAAGAVESIFTILALKDQVLPPTANLDSPGDPPEEFNCNYVPKIAQEHEFNVALANSFGFGGTNGSLCLTKFT